MDTTCGASLKNSKLCAFNFCENGTIDKNESMEIKSAFINIFKLI